MNEVRIRKRLKRIKRKIKDEEMIKEKKGKHGILITFLGIYKFLWCNLGNNFI